VQEIELRNELNIFGVVQIEIEITSRQARSKRLTASSEHTTAPDTAKSPH
jgi:hypothetical protein